MKNASDYSRALMATAELLHEANCRIEDYERALEKERLRANEAEDLKKKLGDDLNLALRDARAGEDLYVAVADLLMAKTKKEKAAAMKLLQHQADRTAPCLNRCPF